MKVIPDTLQQLPDGSCEPSAAGFCYLPVMYVNGLLTTIKDQGQYTTQHEAMKIAGRCATKLLGKDWLLAMFEDDK